MRNLLVTSLRCHAAKENVQWREDSKQENENDENNHGRLPAKEVSSVHDVRCGLTIDRHVASTCELDISLVPGQKFLDEYPARIMESQGLQPKCYTNCWEWSGRCWGAVGPAAPGADSAGSQASRGEDVRSGAGGGP